MGRRLLRLRVVNGEVMEHPIVEVAISYAALLSVIIVIVELAYPLSPEAKLRLYLADLVIVALLALDYAYRASKSGDWKGYVRRNFYELPALIPVGLLALLENYLAGLGFLRLLRLVRVVRLIVLVARGSRFLRLAEETAERLRIIYIAGFATLTILFGASAIYLVESPHPESQIKDFWSALWWAIVTATTVGYGDVVPVTPLGRAVGIMMMLLGIASLSLMVGVIATLFTKALEAERERGVEEERVRELCSKLREVGSMDRAELEYLLGLIEAEWRAARARRSARISEG
jgi:voltage-gated potassium channel